MVTVVLSLVLTASRKQGVSLDVHRSRCHRQSDQIVKRWENRLRHTAVPVPKPHVSTGRCTLDYHFRAAVKHRIVGMSLNASGVRDAARVLPDQVAHASGLRINRGPLLCCLIHAAGNLASFLWSKYLEELHSRACQRVW